MNNGAANLVDRVFPRVPVRQWVLSLPMPLRFRLAWDGALCREVLAVFLSTVFGYYREAAGLPDGRAGSVTFEQTFGSALNANLHFHALVLDGVYAHDEAVFHSVPAPTTAEVQAVVDRVRCRVEALLRRRGSLDDEGELAGEDADGDDDAQRLLLAASVAGREALGLRAGAKPRWMRQMAVRRLPDRCAAAGSSGPGSSTSTPRSASRPTMSRGWSACVATCSAHRCPTTASPSRPTGACS
jgi:hypothetical protein